jgi:hypothetical protein
VLGHAERVSLIESNTRHAFPKLQREQMLRWMRRWLMEIDDAPEEEDFALLRESTLRRKLARTLEGESGLNDPVAILLGGSYAAASFAANLAVLMPSGLFVREAFFLFVASRLGFDPATIIALGAVIRVILTLSDLLFAAMMAVVTYFAGRQRT